jgi:hypothetical protein
MEIKMITQHMEEFKEGFKEGLTTFTPLRKLILISVAAGPIVGLIISFV